MTTRAQGWSDVQAADVAVHRGYGDLIRDAIDAMPGQWTSDDVHAWIGERHPDAAPHHPNLLGAIIGNLAANGHIEPIGLGRTTRRSGRSRRVLIYMTTRSPAGCSPAHQRQRAG